MDSDSRRRETDPRSDPVGEIIRTTFDCMEAAKRGKPCDEEKKK